MKLKRLFAFVLTLKMLFAAVALVIPAAAESYGAEFITEVLADYEIYGQDIFVDADQLAEKFWATQGGQMPDPGNDPGNDPGEVISSFGAYKYVAVIGVDGGATAFDDGYISVSNYYPGTNDFSISFWINTYGTMGDPAILANKDWASGANSGWVLALHSTRLLFNFGNGSSRRDIGFTLPSDYSDGWVHVIITVNHSANQVKCYYDFVEQSMEYDKNGLTLTGTSLTNGSVLNIGQDGLGHEPDDLPGFLDDIMIFNGALTADDVAALKTYYGK